LIWIKRLSPFVLVVVAWFAYGWISEYVTREERERRETVALVMAESWIASALYRDNPEGYLAYRDSLLSAHGMSVDDMRHLEETYRDHPEDWDLIGALVNKYVDSLTGGPADTTLIESDSTAP
jgi:hypothetical protein